MSGNIVQGTLARSWTRFPAVYPFIHPTEGWFAEAGVGINRISGLFSVDLAQRFAQPSGTAVTFSVADFF